MKIHIDQTGLFCGLGSNLSEVYRNMCSGGSVFRPLYRFDSTPYRQQTGGQISPEQEEFLRDSYPEDDLAGALCLSAAAQVAPARFAPSGRTGLVLATNFGPLEFQEWLWQEKLDTGAVSSESRELLDSFSRNLAVRLQCLGPMVQISMSCASGGCALELVRDLLQTGRADQVLVLAYDLITEYSWCGLHNLHTITTETMRPFDVNRSGTIFSEGAAAVLVSREDSPQASRTPYFLTGIATGNNASHLTAPLPGGEGSRRVMAAALADAGLSPEDIGHVSAHATSTQANDRTEAEALRTLFGPKHLQQITVAAPKSQLGHLLGAAALAETALVLEAMKNSIIPPNINLRELDPECRDIDSVPGLARYRSFNRALLNSAGIGGNNCAVVLEKMPGENP